METEKTGTDWKQVVGTGAKLCVHSALGMLWRKEVNSRLIQSAVLAQGCRARATERGLVVRVEGGTTFQNLHTFKISLTVAATLLLQIARC